MNHALSTSARNHFLWHLTSILSIVVLALLAGAPAAAALHRADGARAAAAAVPGAPPFTAPLTTIEIPITAGSDDAGMNAAYSWCTYGTGYNEIYFGQCIDGTGVTSGFRFVQVPLARGAQIIDAYIRFTVDGPYANTLTVRFAGEASGDAATFSSTSPPNSRPLIPNLYADWQITPSDIWTLGETRNSPPLTAIVQAIVNRSDWASGHALAIITQNVGTASGNWPHRRVIAYERASWIPGSEDAARLIVTYNDTPNPQFTWQREAETGSVSGAMQVGADPGASACHHVASTGAGPNDAVTFDLNVPYDDQYYLWARARGIDWTHNSFWVRVDGGTDLHFEVQPDSQGHWVFSWQAVSSMAQPQQPFTLPAGAHTIRFQAREPLTQLDAVFLVNRGDVLPTQVTPCGVTPTATPTPTNTPTSTPTNTPTNTPTPTPTPTNTPTPTPTNTPTATSVPWMMFLPGIRR